MRQIAKEDIARLYILMQNIKHCANMAGYYEGMWTKSPTEEKMWFRKKKNDYEDTKHKYWKVFMEIIYEIYGSEATFKEDIADWHKDLEDINIGPYREPED